MTTPTGPYTVKYASMSLPGEVVGPPITLPGVGVFFPRDGSSLTAEAWALALNHVHHSARAPLLELLRECEPYLDTYGNMLPALSRLDLLARIRAAIKETAP